MAYGNALSKLFSYHVAATQQIAPGERERNFSIQSTSPMTARGLMMMKQAVREHGRTIVSLIYNVAGETPKLDRVWMMMPTTDPAVLACGEDLTLLVDCKVWAPSGEGPMVIVAPQTFGGHFVLSAEGTRLEHRPTRPARQLIAGMRRAEQRIARAARSRGLQAPRDTTLLIAA
jgi:hypothetical protein